MIDLGYWYNKYIAICPQEDERVFRANITWVHDLPPKSVELMRGGKIVVLKCHISPNRESISDVFVSRCLPDYFCCSTPMCLLLNAATGEWFTEDCTRTRVRVIIAVVEEKWVPRPIPSLCLGCFVYCLCYHCQMENERHLLFTDGSSLGNPGPGGWGAVLVLGGKQLIELGGYEKHTTNNRMELLALIRGLERLVPVSGDLTIFTDSKYVHKGATEWSVGWKMRGWTTMGKTPVENRDLWEIALPLLDDRKKFGSTKWTHVPGHSGMAGNERCDEIATGYAKEEVVGLYEGELADYAVDILNIAVDEEKSDARSLARAHSRAKAYSYLSLVGGVAKRHLTWGECESRVKGKAGVRYKKSISIADENEILKSWGVKEAI